MLASENCNILNTSSLTRFVSFSFSTQTYILELIKELGFETYPQYNAGKNVHHMGGPQGQNSNLQYQYFSSVPTGANGLHPATVEGEAADLQLCSSEYVQVEVIRFSFNFLLASACENNIQNIQKGMM